MRRKGAASRRKKSCSRLSEHRVRMCALCDPLTFCLTAKAPSRWTPSTYYQKEELKKQKAIWQTGWMGHFCELNNGASRLTLVCRVLRQICMSPFLLAPNQQPTVSLVLSAFLPLCPLILFCLTPHCLAALSLFLVCPILSFFPLAPIPHPYRFGTTPQQPHPVLSAMPLSTTQG